MANLAPRAVPEAAIRPGAVAFAAGMVVLLAGLVLRGWSFKVLGEYFTHTVMVGSDQPVIATGPYRVLLRQRQNRYRTAAGRVPG